MKAAIHFGPNYLANLEVYKNTNFEEIQSLLKITQKLILEHSEEILNVNTIESTSTSWTRSVLSRDQVIRWSKAKVRVYSDSVLCLGKLNGSKDAITWWKGQVEEFSMSPFYKELLGIDFEAIEFEWNIFPGFPSLHILQKIQDDVRERNIEPEKCTDPIIFMSMFNDVDWTKKGNGGRCISNLENVKDHAKRFSQGHWTLLGLGDEKKWHGTLPDTPEGKWNSTANLMIQRHRSPSVQEYQRF